MKCYRCCSIHYAEKSLPYLSMEPVTPQIAMTFSKKKGCILLISPRKNAVLWEDSHPRNDAVVALNNRTIEKWKAESGYHYRSISETAMPRYKGLTSGKLSLRCYNAQVGEIMTNVKVINKVLGLGMTVRDQQLVIYSIVDLQANLINNASN